MKLFIFLFAFLSVVAHSEPSVWHDKNSKAIRVGNLSPGEVCGGYNSAFVIHKGIVDSYEISKDYLNLKIKLDDDYENLSSKSIRTLNISNAYLWEIGSQNYLEILQLIASKQKLIFTGYLCGATYESAIDVDSIFKYSAISGN